LLHTASPVTVAQAYEMRDAGAVLHSHSIYSVLATMLDPGASEFRVTHLEMIKVSVGETQGPANPG
jgi:methylthioribulose 1-phosphate dehydratase/enolase-phosphatase E1